MGSYSQQWWNHTDLDCSIEQIEVALESVIISELLPLSTSGDITVSGIVSIFVQNNKDLLNKMENLFTRRQTNT